MGKRHSFDRSFGFHPVLGHLHGQIVWFRDVADVVDIGQKNGLLLRPRLNGEVRVLDVERLTMAV